MIQRNKKTAQRSLEPMKTVIGDIHGESEKNLHHFIFFR